MIRRSAPMTMLNLFFNEKSMILFSIIRQINDYESVPGRKLPSGRALYGMLLK
jgi:hypothetical protein